MNNPPLVIYHAHCAETRNTGCSCARRRAREQAKQRRERIAVKAEECGITPGEAAERLYSIYRPV